MPTAPTSLKVLNKEGKEFNGSDVFSGDKKVMLYFSAHWCPPCRQFTPLLKDFYEEAKSQNVECVFVSCDRDEKSMWDYFKESHGDYYVLPFDSKERTSLAEEHNISGIPALVVVDKDGKVIKENARSDVQSKGPACIKEWK